MWDKLTVRQYQQINEVSLLNYDAPWDRTVQMLAILEGKPLEWYEALTLVELSQRQGALDFMSELPPMISPNLVKANGRWYKPVYHFDELTAGQYVDLMHLTKDESQIVPLMHRILAAFCVPCKKRPWGIKSGRYGDRPTAEVAEDMLHLTAKEAMGIALFFWTVLNSFVNATADYLKAETRAIPDPVRRLLVTILENAGDGLPTSTPWLNSNGYPWRPSPKSEP